MVSIQNFKSCFVLILFPFFLHPIIRAQAPPLAAFHLQTHSLELQLSFNEVTQLNGRTVIIETDAGLGNLESASILQSGAHISIHPDRVIPDRWHLQLPNNIASNQTLRIDLRFEADNLSNYREGGIVIVEVVEGYRANGLPADISLWPNPCQQQMFLSSSVPLSIITIQRLDGTILRTFNGPFVNGLDLTGIEPGLLILKATGVQGQVYIKPFQHQ